jgi:hypothetical protein
MKQTAVKWMANELLHLDHEFDMKLIDKNEYQARRKQVTEQAKEMEKMQHQETFNQARLAKIFEKDMPPVWDSWYQYYNITFKSE